TFKPRRWYYRFMHSLMIVPILVSFFLTSSRGGLVALAISFMVFLVIMPVLRQLSLMIVLLVSTISSFLILDVLSEARNMYLSEGIVSYKGWIVLIAISFTVSLVILLFE